MPPRNASTMGEGPSVRMPMRATPRCAKAMPHPADVSSARTSRRLTTLLQGRRYRSASLPDDQTQRDFGAPRPPAEPSAPFEHASSTLQDFAAAGADSAGLS